ncbi:DNA polymerase III subunit delta' [Paenibacillus mucilaginosus]|uniref:DNA polymerase III subunit delta' n=1 Tax=Paenibacillus mucilaginosus (strain KNP414) TaxID=1036673 RepID=F8FCM3_PAEMK|nr:DNA polymerase III subunit delta' [Paenibacillus mucilaginosus]AEI46114.1 DNA polymerase III subunit delta' [Paenibacillus mucilaginosus KNP414]MCG7217928.1 DNA polymerase III subunit delta' [Paenibacillus mucilaginosus]WDM27449.1 DNA polymerase III subunit delta' [Paenibacillus mucilaginosus]
MSFRSIQGQDRVKQVLQNSLRSDKVSHAYIFTGPGGTGRREMAKAFAQAIYCKVLPDDACGQCLDCRKVEHGNHPDLHWIVPDGSSIKIEQIRDLQKQFAYRASASGTKMYVLEQADKMTVQASNSLLKFLEEPTSQVVAVLITDNGQALLPTIRSRSQWISFLPMGRVQMKEKLLAEGHAPLLVQIAVHMAAGTEAARALIQTNGFAELRNLVIQLAKESLTRLPSALLTAQQKLAKGEFSEQLPQFMDMLILWLKDMVQLCLGSKDDIIYTDGMDWMTQQALSYPIDHWIACLEQAIETQKRLRFHANPQLALENILLRLKGV